ncbi:universal stress protein [Conexibacter sp. JD483]|uniref:universal stress protein n=1 Tax=unclassified Conexibacter TaxID=2627773 RepID=UPI00271C35FE|nr:MULTISPECIES: universal stress protein [unclassified Conexibacter]MDO8185613.1 universal stress protein [Conexibacter sp. CPCC 205706]MDO8198786.1 universal stress protein [Conexibacter sp. CPCC 205762]MDR9367864.1 universal stress protein [Conexibacter sp. JD483]
MFRNILVGVDGSPASDRALERAVELARDGHARLTLLTAVPKPPGFAAGMGDASAVAALVEGLDREALARLAEAVAAIPDELPVTTLVSRRPVCRALLERVSTGCHDLVVVGTRDHGRLRRWLSGSVSRAMIRRCEVPVLVVHDDRPQPTRRSVVRLTRRRPSSSMPAHERIRAA